MLKQGIIYICVINLALPTKSSFQTIKVTTEAFDIAIISLLVLKCSIEFLNLGRLMNSINVPNRYVILYSA